MVSTADEFDRALAGAKREAKASFGSDQVLVEKFLHRPRHIEMQIFADGCGNALHMFERDCSIQRRHQKVVEEAPAPTLDPATRDAMGEAAVTAVKTIDYLGAGTVEFLLEGNGAFYFMEMNTRLQVEHGVTELITGQDLVEWQLRVAAGEPLPCAPQDLVISGHAIEARVYAEDPERGFLPATGHLTHLRFPSDSRHLRVDTGVREGDAVTIHYDPMIAKLMVWDHDRAAALRRMRSTLAATQVVGLVSNIDFLASVFGHSAFTSGDYDVSFVDQHKDELTAVEVPATDTVVALASLYTLKQRERQVAAEALGSADPYSPWHLNQGWRLNEDPHERLRWHSGREEIEVMVYYRGDDYLIQTASGSLVAVAELNAASDLIAELNGVRLRATVVPEDGALTLLFRGSRHSVSLHTPAAMAIEEEVAPSSMTAPMPGRVVQVWVRPGDRVKRGETLLVLEAMKMEHTLTAPADGQVAVVNISGGDLIEEGIELLRFQPQDGSNLP
jgi:3-methylcrotonyl-CoA carboxylase alpha subunit